MDKNVKMVAKRQGPDFSDHHRFSGPGPFWKGPGPGGPPPPGGPPGPPPFSGPPPFFPTTTRTEVSTSTRTSTSSSSSSITSSPTGTPMNSPYPISTSPMTYSTTPQLTAPAATASSTSPAVVSSASLAENRTFVIALSTALSVIVILLLAGAVFLWRRYRQRRLPLFERGVTPIDDEEIESWKVSRESRDEEKCDGACGKEASLVSMAAAPGTSRHTKNASSTTTLRKAPSVIVYQNQSSPSHHYNQKSEDFSPRSFNSNAGLTGYYGRRSLDQEMPQTPLQARAPNARQGLTDMAVPGDEPFLPQPRRQPSRISKLPGPLTSPRSVHGRSRSSRSSFRSFAERPSFERTYNPYNTGYGGSEQDLRWGRSSSDYPRSPPAAVTEHQLKHTKSATNHPGYVSHSRVYSTSSIPPRISFSDDFMTSPILASPKWPVAREDIGRAIG